MTRRSIPGQLNPESDADLRTALELVHEGLQVADLETVDLTLLVDAANVAASLPMEFGDNRDAVAKYILALEEPQRSIFRHRLAGRKARQIAEIMEMDHRSVCRSLSVIFAEMQALLNRQLQ
jgi:DNA-directed RNA polymerase specialized sigma24 family protein